MAGQKVPSFSGVQQHNVGVTWRWFGYPAHLNRYFHYGKQYLRGFYQPHVLTELTNFLTNCSLFSVEKYAGILKETFHWSINKFTVFSDVVTDVWMARVKKNHWSVNTRTYQFLCVVSGRGPSISMATNWSGPVAEKIFILRLWQWSFPFLMHLSNLKIVSYSCLAMWGR